MTTSPNFCRALRISLLSAREMGEGFATMWIACEARRPAGGGIMFRKLMLQYAMISGRSADGAADDAVSACCRSDSRSTYGVSSPHFYGVRPSTIPLARI